MKRRILPLAMFAILALLAVQTCEGELSQAVVEVNIGAAVDEVAVDVMRPGEPDDRLVASFRRQAPAGPVRFDLQLDPGGYRLEIKLRVGDDTRLVERAIEVAEGESTVRVDVSREATGLGAGGDSRSP